MIIAQSRYDFSKAEWYLSGKIGSTSSRLKSKGYGLDSHRFSYRYLSRETPVLAPKVLSTWSK